MRRLPGAFLGLLAGCMLGQAQHIVPTMRTHPACPVTITSVSPSREFGFESVTFRDDSGKPISALHLTVVLAAESREEVADGGRVFAQLDPGGRKKVDVFLGRIPALAQRAKELRQTEARAILYVDSVDFADGTQWNWTEPGLDIPLQVRPLK
ncbi:MAG TPA: hypothetical protein VJ732_11070 [Bryobacteraceae bacterium]|nr:hypothetical protein [Bryobacteraceae bacterium]